MKRILKKYFVLALAVMMLAAAFTGCKDAEPTEFTYNNKNSGDSNNNNNSTITTIKGLYILDPPEEVTATAYGPTGVIRVSWMPVPNANGYMVYRRTVGANGMTSVYNLATRGNTYDTTSPTIALREHLFIDDTNSFINEFEVGATYTYRVVAFSNWSSNPAGSGWSFNDQTLEDYTIIQNSSTDSEAVSFTASGTNALLGAGQQLAAPTGLTLRRTNVFTTASGTTFTTGDVVQATWKSVPGVDYVVGYGMNNPDGPTIVYYTQIVNRSGTNSATAAAIIPFIYGNMYVEVIAIARSEARGNATTAYYYKDSPAASSTLNVFPTNLAQPDFLQATEYYNKVGIRWSPVPGANSYRIFRFLGTDDYNNTSNVYGSSTLNTTDEGWREITGSLTYSVITDEDTNEILLHRAYDDFDGKPSDLVKLSNLYYMIVAVNESRSNMSLPLRTHVTQHTPIEVNASSLGWDDSLDAGDGNWRGVHIRWTYTDQHSSAYPELSNDISRNDFTLHRFNPVNNTWIDITNSTANGSTTVTREGINSFAKIDIAPIRQAAKYKVVAAWGEEVHAEVTTIPYIEDFTFSLSFGTTIPSVAITESPNTTATRRQAYTIGVQPTINMPGLRAGNTELDRTMRLRQMTLLWAAKPETVTIYRIKTTAATLLAPTGVTYGGDYYEVIKLTSLDGFNIGPDFRIATLDIPNDPGNYRYRVDVLKNGVNNTVSEVITAATNPTITAVGTTATVIESGTNSIILRVVGQGLVPSGTNNTYPDLLQGTKIIFRVATGATATEAFNNFNAGIFTVIRNRLNRTGAGADDNTYETPTVPIGAATAKYIVVTYENGSFDSMAATGNAVWGTDLATTQIP